MSEDILETIDHALDDWATSGDAMRWCPDAAPQPTPQPALRPSPRLQAHWSGRTPLSLDPSPLATAFASVRESIERAMTAEVEASLRRAMARIDAAADEPPTEAPDPRQRALDARHNRGTGPAARRLDGRRA